MDNTKLANNQSSTTGSKDYGNSNQQTKQAQTGSTGINQDSKSADSTKSGSNFQ